MTPDDVVPLARPRVGSEELEAVARVLASRHLARGPEAAALERDVVALLRVGDVLAVSSGGAALLLALKALGVGPGDEVVVPAYTFPAAAQAAWWLGATPVPADVSEETLAVDAATVAARIGPATRAIVVAHAFGIPADIEDVIGVARDLPVVEDAACSLGGRTPSGRPSGTVGTIGCFSLHPRKLATAGEGGLVVATGEAARAVRELHDYGRTGAGFGDVFGGMGLNFRLSDVAAAIARVQVARLTDSLARRGRLAARYLDRLEGLPGVRVPSGGRRAGNAWQSFVVRVTDGPVVVERLRAIGIQAGVAAHDLCAQAVYRARCGEGPPCPTSAALGREAIALPLFDEMDEAQVDRVARALRDVVNGR